MSKELVFMNGEINEKGGSVQVIGGVTASGKTEHAIGEVVKAIKNNESVLIFSTEEKPQHVIERLVRTLAPEEYDNYRKEAEESSETSGSKKEVQSPDEIDEAIDLISNSNTTILYGVEDEYDIVERIREKSLGEKGLDLVVIDALKLFPIKTPKGEDEAPDKSISDLILERTEKFNPGLSCKVLITIQLSRSFHESA